MSGFVFPKGYAKPFYYGIIILSVVQDPPLYTRIK